MGRASAPEGSSARSALFDVTGRVVIVTGAARGNGAAIAAGFAAAGARVVRVDRIDLPPLPPVEGQAAAAGYPLDLTVDLVEGRSAAGVLEATLDRFGRLDVLVNNAGVSLACDDPYADSPEAEAVWDRTLAVNLEAAWRLARGAARIMAGQGSGSIINVTSLGAVRGFPGNPSYQASKAALRQLTLALARDFGKQGVRVNNLCPGYIHTAMTDASFRDPQKHAERLSHMMLDRWGMSEDLVGPCLFLASDAARYVTGIDLPVDGGWLARGL